MTPRQIIEGCRTQTIERTDDGRWHAQCVGCDIGATGDTEEDAWIALDIVIKAEIGLAVEADAAKEGDQ